MIGFRDCAREENAVGTSVVGDSGDKFSFPAGPPTFK